MNTTVLPSLFSYRKFWAHKLGIAPELPSTRAEMDALGWDCCDVILITGDAYIDHPSFGMALIGRLLEAQGFRVGIIAQPDWRSLDSFTALGVPSLFFGITAGNMDSLVNHYTADRKPRSDDAYTPGGIAGKRPDRAVIVYSHCVRAAFKQVPIVIGGIEASLRRLAHYDYWSDQVRRSILFDAKADLLLYGNAERAIVALAHRLARGEPIQSIHDLRGTAFIIPTYQSIPANSMQLAAFEQVRDDRWQYANAARQLHHELNPHNARILIQPHGGCSVWVNPPPLPLTTAELDQVYELPYSRRPHSQYGNQSIPAWEMIRFSTAIVRGCFGGCSFCSITAHEGRITQSRSVPSILRELANIRDRTPGFTGVISDLGGPTANMWQLTCKDPQIEARCRRLSCLYPTICPRLNTNHAPLIDLYRQARAVPGIKRVFIASGVRYDLALKSTVYIKELATYHVGGYLKIAPEHTEFRPLELMLKPGIRTYEQFKQLFDRYSQTAGKKQYVIPYFIAAHPGSRDEDMLQLALWLKQQNLRLDQVQSFLPTPMALATAMYYTGLNPLKTLTPHAESVFVVRDAKQRRLQKAFLRYHDPVNWPMLRAALHRLGRSDLIGHNKKRHLIPRA
ncbi:YgiQ family radical SAM protein [Thiospirillum jenense]|uniref:YgiQ family radical SAM protein n=1 Tax=Thiospirillum jenense TaxID=1653858 RepID=A0A839HAQ0_9GAMM|nr:YgiQ family radical SAM protein [Thiospirillum jenense]MBB1126145.1 YgiQ family radical SAM protein [Thiospirillum jenense]